MDEYFGNCEKLAFSTVPSFLKNIARDGINNIVWEFSTSENPWKFEIDTNPYIGAGEYIISSKRQSYQGIAIEDVTTLEEKALAEIQDLFNLAELELGRRAFTDDDKSRINAALALSAISFTLWGCLVVGLIVKKYILRI